MSGALYNRDIIRLAARLADYPMPDAPQARVERRTSVCGSRLALGLDLDDGGCVCRVGITPHLCALGQASAAIFASHCCGKSRAELITARDAMKAWLADGDAPTPDWPELDAVADARAAPSRHESVMLAFEAGVEAACCAGGEAA
ncbi:iron-sulfur cluster assembly scaffold protein [Sphingorhabdus soli]|uniref:Iron-sulfur cluster assembly scaffold protein n=1 Tax=Flavisphingopyxis soli TaxID=2601267 RepID=A0A5C6U7N9_9SPHN|nr:iron-sulfur cluster assembly scaffold protein [Sphingorhabdus soli]TXC68869.1 iron-sulfur cluster assembly scaffold protein [Sphingorhabdus soli]